ncbi:MAG TPA: alanine--glyoxylate aminotransferase family protein [Anaerolineae bacterium]|nr:alanine--glyoxylate aminotransferase family protein [Anaerolineae bacterium]HOQ99458.1 alanine--glyoxylate aminotransferase family protein [Anaerolineae bacterium]HPL29804.1 alanine--glyoxylate aminotransferase family protein [Anaerolineae bacterium]
MDLRVPGPTPLPPPVREALAAEMINHRGAEFRALLAAVTAGLQHVLQTEGDVLVLTGSGTGAMEAAIVNLISPGDRVLAVTVGAFGDRFAEVAQAFGAEVSTVASPWGRAANALALEDALARTPHVRLVLVTHNETSTGVTNDLRALAEVVGARRGEGGPLLVVDAVSSAGAIPLPVDAWGCDVAITGSQKAWMAPPGVSMLSMSERAWAAAERATCPRYYWDLRKACRAAERHETPWTPAVNALQGLHAALAMMRAEGLEAIYARHRRVAHRMREGAKALGLELFADPAHASNTVTTLRVPEGVDGEMLLRRVRELGVTLAGGQGALKGRIIRVGHMGYVDTADIDRVLQALAAALG